MKKLVVMTALIAAIGLQPGLAAEKKAARSSCPSASEAEAEQAIRFMTDVMVVSSTCQDTIYAEFRLRNQEPIRAYQKAMITHFHGNKAFDTWNTSLANQYAAKRAGLPSAQICQETAELMKTAQTLDPAGFRKYAVAQAAATQTPGCGK